MKKIFILLLIALVLLSGCGDADEPAPVPVDEQRAAPEQTYEKEPVGIAYSPKDSLNPLETRNKLNLDLAGLVYQGLFELDESFNPIPVLCQSISSAENVYTIKIKSGITFSDGSALTAGAVVNSIKRAMDEKSYFAPRLGVIESVSVKKGAVEIVSSCKRLDALLDFPIVSESGLGTGEFHIIQRDGANLLQARDGREIEMTPVTSADELIFSFESQRVDIVSLDRTGADPIRFRGEYEAREFDTLIYDCLKLNASAGVLSNPIVRRAIAASIDRAAIAETDFASLAVPTLSRVHPSSPAYNAETAKGFAFSFEGARTLLESAELRRTPSVEILVNSENKNRIAACEHISVMLSDVGIKASVRSVSWDEFKRLTEKGEYDIYYAEQALTADFLPEEPAFYSDATEIPILFKKYSAITHRNVFSSISPTYTNLFYKFSQWK